MSWVQELFDVVGKLNFVEKVYEYQQGLYFRAGVAIPKRIRYHGEDLEAIVTGEETVRDMVGVVRFVPFARPRLPHMFRRSKVLGRIRCEVRDAEDVNLRAGIYFYLPFVDAMTTDSIQERMISLGTLTLETKDEETHEPVLVSPNVRYQITNFYKAFTAVHDYESILKDYILSILAQHSREMTIRDWTSPERVEVLQELVLEETKEVTDSWGLTVKNVYVVDAARCMIHKLIPKTSLVNVLNKAG